MDRKKKNSFFTAVLKSKRVIHSLNSYFQDNAYRCHEWGSAHVTFTTLLLSWSKLWSLWIPSSNCTFTHNIRFWRRFWRLLTALTLKPVLLCKINFMTANTNTHNFSWTFITCNTEIDGPFIRPVVTSCIWCTLLSHTQGNNTVCCHTSNFHCFCSFQQDTVLFPTGQPSKSNKSRLTLRLLMSYIYICSTHSWCF